MPNWCYNRIRIDADSDQVEQLKEIHDIFDKHTDPFNQILPIPDFKNIPNEKGELPVLRRELNKDGSVFYETYDFPDGKVRMMTDGITGALTTGEQSGSQTLLQ